MAKKNFYAVRKGRTQGLFRTWDECKASVIGFPGAEFKGFITREEALDYLNTAASGTSEADEDLENSGPSPDSTDSSPEESAVFSFRERHCRIIPEGSMIAYVDGSFSKAHNRYSYGCVLLLPGGEIHRESGSGSDAQGLAIRNVAGEMLGAETAVKWAVANGYHSIKICYDYKGVEEWASGGWKTNNELTKNYADFMQGQRPVIKITFQKIAAHTGNTFNEEADRLAKAALTGEGS